jgi:hypothetical protein
VCPSLTLDISSPVPVLTNQQRTAVCSAMIDVLAKLRSSSNLEDSSLFGRGINGYCSRQTKLWTAQYLSSCARLSSSANAEYVREMVLREC